MFVTTLTVTLTPNERTMVASAINVYGDSQHPMAMPNALDNFDTIYIAHCLGRQHYATIGLSGSNESIKHSEFAAMHEQICDKLRSLHGETSTKNKNGVIFEINMGTFPISVTQLGKDKFQVTYGEQFKVGDYAAMSKELGECIFHSLALNGVLRD